MRAIVQEADRDRPRRDRRRRAVARVLRALYAPSPDRARRRRLAADARRPRRLSAIQERVPAAASPRPTRCPTARILPKAIGAIAYADRVADRSRVRGFPRRARAGRRARSSRRSSPRRRPASSRRSCRTSTTTRSSAISMRSPPRCRSNTRRSCATASCCSSIAPTSRWSATPPIATARSPTSSASSRWWWRRSTRRVREHPAREDPAARVLGQLRGPARSRRRAARHPARHPAGEGRRDLPAVRQSAPRARVSRAGDIPLARRPADHRRRDRHADQFRRASGGHRRPHRAHRGRDRRSAPRAGGTDCGFDTSAGMGRVTEDVVWAKLRALRDGARLASQRLYRL